MAIENNIEKENIYDGNVFFQCKPGLVWKRAIIRQ
jgi:hypothetical protein